VSLVVRELVVDYGEIRAVSGASLTVRPGEVRTILGPNGAGKSSIIRAIAGATRPTSGAIEFPEGESISGLKPNEVRARGIAWVPEGREIFNTLTVAENLSIGAWQVRDRAERARRAQDVYGLFPRLWDRRRNSGAALSGGEQQMLAIGRALMSRPSLLLMDEPSLGLAPMAVDQVFKLITLLRGQGLGLLLVEQNAKMALRVADWAYLLESGQVRLDGAADQVRESDHVRRVYLGV
jgi:branched-chain amino acid transport system ATP-binding protein